MGFAVIAWFAHKAEGPEATFMRFSGLAAQGLAVLISADWLTLSGSSELVYATCLLSFAVTLNCVTLLFVARGTDDDDPAGASD